MVQAHCYLRRLTKATACVIALLGFWARESFSITLTPTLAHGSASGDPQAESIVLWTRVTPPTGCVDQQFCVQLTVIEVACIGLGRRKLRQDCDDNKQKSILCTSPHRDHTVKALVTGLKPATRYRYRFQPCSSSSQTLCWPTGNKLKGFFKTLPAETAAVDQLKFVTLSCSNWAAGYFNAYQVLASDPAFANLDFVIHLGDYYYDSPIEGPDSFPFVNSAVFLAQQDRFASFKNSPDYPALLGQAPTSLDEFRARHRLTKSDPAVQAVHAAHAFITTWDDHEFRDDIYSTGPYPNTAELIDNAVRAYYEWMPIRDPVECAYDQSFSADSAECKQARLDTFRTFAIGNLASIVVPETRVRSRTAQFYNIKSDTDPSGVLTMVGAVGFAGAGLLDPSIIDPSQQQDVAAFLAVGTQAFANDFQRTTSLMGSDQISSMEAAFRRGSTWNVLAQQTPMLSLVAPDIPTIAAEAGPSSSGSITRTVQRVLGSFPQEQLPKPTATGGTYVGLLQPFFASLAQQIVGFVASGVAKLPFQLDSWDGYPDERERVFDAACRATSTCKGNFISLAGDTHNIFTGKLFDKSGTLVGHEIVCQSVTAPGFEIVGAVLKNTAQVAGLNDATIESFCGAGCPEGVGNPDGCTCPSDVPQCNDACQFLACCAAKDAVSAASAWEGALQNSLQATNTDTLDQAVISSSCKGFMLHSVSKTSWDATPICQEEYFTRQCSADSACPSNKLFTYSIPAS